ncbi:unnamed protein product, partial [Didymodactylos carnosus]
ARNEELGCILEMKYIIRKTSRTIPSKAPAKTTSNRPSGRTAGGNEPLGSPNSSTTTQQKSENTKPDLNTTSVKSLNRDLLALLSTSEDQATWSTTVTPHPPVHSSTQ